MSTSSYREEGLRSPFVHSGGYRLLRRSSLLLFFLCFFASVSWAQSQRVFVNEFRYDSRIIQNGQTQFIVPNLIEIAGPANTDVTSWSVVFYRRVPEVNGNRTQGTVYGFLPLSGVIPDQENGYGVLSYTLTANTLTDETGGFAVVTPTGEVTNFISYETQGTSMTAIDGPANGLQSLRTPSGGSTNGNQSLQLQGTGSIYTDFTWAPVFTATPGEINKAFNNNDQIFVQPTFINITSVSPSVVTERTSNTAVVTVTATRPVVGDQSVAIRGTGIPQGDFGFSRTTIPILSGATSGTTLLQISNDDVINGPRTLQLEIFRPSESVFIGSTSAVSVSVLDDDQAPALAVSPSALSFSTTPGVASAEQTYVISATALRSSLDVRSPEGYEVSRTSGSGFAPNLSLPSSTTSLTVYVRLRSGLTAGSYNGTIVNFSGSQTANVGVTGTVGSATVANGAPVATANANQTATSGVNFSYQVAAFTDPNGDAITYTASGLPAGLSFDAGTRTISGTPSTSGVSTVIVTGTDPGSLSASTTFTITVNPAPIVPPTNQAPVAVGNTNQTATVGVNFSYQVSAFTDPNGDAITYTASGLPAGLNFDAGTRTISGTPSTSGVSTVTITGTDPGGLSASTNFQITVNPAPVVPPTNQAPIATPIANRTATVGVSVSFDIPAFTDPNGDALVYTASGLPAGLSFDAGTRTISGTPSTSGVSTVTITGTDPGSLSASTTFTITVNPAPIVPPTNQAPVAVANTNQTGTVGVSFQYTINAFTDPNNDALTYSASGLPAGLNFDMMTRNISGTPSTSGVSTVTITGTDPGGLSASTNFQITISSSVTTTPPVDPPVGGSLQFLPPAYDCGSGVFTFRTTGGDGSPITFSAIGIVGPTTVNGLSFVDNVDDGLAAEIRRQSSGVEPIELVAVQNGIRIIYLWDARNACNGSNPNPNPNPGTPPQGSCGSPANTIGQPLVLLQPTYDCASGIIRFNTTGGNGSPITYFGVGVTAPTTDCVASVDRGNTDANTFTLSATQNGVTSTVTWVRPCAAARRATSDVPTDLNISVFGNPVVGDVVEFTVRGAEGQPMRASLVDTRGQIVSEVNVAKADATEVQTLRMGRSAGLYLIRVVTPGRVGTAKVLKQ